MKKTLLYLLALSLISCHSPVHFYNKGDYKKAYSKSLKKIAKNPSKIYSFENILINSSRKLNESDLMELTELLNTNLYAFKAHKKVISKIEQRQSNLTGLYNDINRDIQYNKFNWIDCTELIKHVDENAVSYYNKKLKILNDSILSGKKQHAPIALKVLDTLKLYGSNNFDYDESYLNIINHGSTYFRINLKNETDEITYDNLLSEVNIQKANSTFHKFTLEENEDVDHNLIIEILDLNPGYENLTESTTCHSKEVIDRYENKIVKVEIAQPPIKKIVKMWCDSVWIEKEVWESVPPIIKEENKLEPVYIKVSATETTTKISKQAIADIRITFLDIDTKAIIFNSTYCYTDEKTTISGDDRAFTSKPICFLKFLSTPSDDTMVERLKENVKDDIIHNLKNYTKKLLATN